MSLSSIFHKVENEIKGLPGQLEHLSVEALDWIDDNAGLIQHYATVAVPICADIANVLTPIQNTTAGKDLELAISKVSGLATKFNAHVPANLSTAADVNSYLQQLAIGELEKAAPTVSTGLLNTAVALAFNRVQAAQATA